MPLLIVCSVIVAGGFLFAFLWATRSGQYDDMQTPSMKMIFDDEMVDKVKATKKRITHM